MSENDKQIIERIKPKLEEAKRRKEEMQASDFVQWLIENYVPEPLREQLTDEARNNQRKLQKFLVQKVLKHIKTDNFVNDEREKQILMEEICIIANSVNETLKGN